MTITKRIINNNFPLKKIISVTDNNAKINQNNPFLLFGYIFFFKIKNKKYIINNHRVIFKIIDGVSISLYCD